MHKAMPEAPTAWGAVVMVVTGLALSFGLEAQVMRERDPDAQLIGQGRLVYEAKCGACHSADAHRVGPLHQGVLGRTAGKVAGFTFSAALARSNLVWSANTLDRWLTDPESVIAGQQMGYSLGQPQERAAVIAFLKTLKAP
jgi:cytochrome c